MNKNIESLVYEIISKPKELSDDQKEAVLSKNKYIRVIAGAGAGKTETLTRRIVHLLLIDEVEPSSIVAFTFTERAAQSMKSRVYQRILQLDRDDIAKRLGEMYIGTIHGFCLQILKDHFGYGNYGIFDENQEMAFLMRIGWGLGLNVGGFYSQNCEVFLNNVNMVYSETLARSILKKGAPVFYEQLTKYEDILDSNKRLTFSRMVYECVLKLQENPDKLDYIRYLIVDEFQDVDHTQFLLIKLIGSMASVFVVGDPRQSIYQWRGSNERFFHDFLNEFGDSHPVEIRENRRSTRRIVHVSNEFADCFTDIDYEHLDPIRTDEGEVVKLGFQSDDDEAIWIADQIERLIHENDCKFSDFGILLRSINTSGEPFIQVFKDRKIPYIVGGKVGLFKRDEAQAVGRLLSWLSDDGFWIENPYNWSEKTTGDSLLMTGLERWRKAVDFPLPDDIVDELENWKAMVLFDAFPDFKSVCYALLNCLGYHNFDLENASHLACMANLGRFSALVGDYEVALRLDKGKCNWKSESNNVCWFMNTYACKAYEEQAVEDIRQVNAVQLMTVHQAKGLEWPIVFLPALVKRRFPSSMTGRPREWLVPRDLFDVDRYEGGIEEEKRLFYVAITRARDKLVLSYFKKYKKAESQSKFLSTLDETLVDKADPEEYQLEYEPMERIEEEEIQTYSITEIIDYMRCPHHYRLNKLWGYIQAFSPLIGYGDALHFCLRHASELIQNERYDPISAVATAVDEEFFLPFANKNLTEKTRKEARRALVNFARKHETDMNNIVEVESRLEFPLQNATLVGKVDVIMKDGNSFEIRDYKTSDRVITEADSKLQLRLYSLGLRETGWKIDLGSIAYLKDASIKEVSVDPEVVNKSRSIADDTIGKISSGCFNPKPSEFCSDCEYNSICRWRK